MFYLSLCFTSFVIAHFDRMTDTPAGLAGGGFLFDPAFATGRLDIILHHAAERVGKGVAPLPFFLHRRIEPDDNITIAIDFWRAVGAVFRGQCRKGSQKLRFLLFIIHNQTPA